MSRKLVNSVGVLWLQDKMLISTMAGNGEHTGHTEISPLLGSHRNDGASKTVVPLPKGGLRHEADEAATINGSNAARESQFQGLPEAQKRLRYIVPAISVGVCPHYLALRQLMPSS